MRSRYTVDCLILEENFYREVVFCHRRQSDKIYQSSGSSHCPPADKQSKTHPQYVPSASGPSCGPLHRLAWDKSSFYRRKGRL